MTGLRRKRRKEEGKEKEEGGAGGGTWHRQDDGFEAAVCRGEVGAHLTAVDEPFDLRNEADRGLCADVGFKAGHRRSVDADGAGAGDEGRRWS